INTVHNANQKNQELKREDIAASFQASVVEVLTEKTYRAAKKHQVKQVIVAGGVAANQGLRKQMEQKFNDEKIDVFFQPLFLN
ncbi:MAG: tRNA (adenosine(37)-N6)-threonylcarbamoyltransferase complex transferase subunit TsaD, partial [Bacillales bacterium]